MEEGKRDEKVNLKVDGRDKEKESDQTRRDVKGVKSGPGVEEKKKKGWSEGKEECQSVEK